MRLRDMLTSMRVQLLEPRPQQPSRQYLLELLSANIQSAFNQASGTGRAHAVLNTILTVSPSQGEYILNGQNIGRIIDVVTHAPDDPNWIERQIEFFDYSEMAENWDLFRDSASWLMTPDGLRHTAQRMAFFRKGGQQTTYVKVLPIPQDGVQYRVAHTVRNYGGADTSLDDDPILSNHHHYWVALTCRDALPACKWSDDKDANKEMRANLRMSFDVRIATLQPQFLSDIATLTIPRDSERVAPFSIDA